VAASSSDGLSVVIPCFNAGVFVAEAVESVRAQPRLTATEVIVVDDGSNDPETCRALHQIEALPGVRVLRSEANEGVQLARNRGVGASQFDFVMSLDADDRLSADPLLSSSGSYTERAMAILRNDHGIAFVHTMSRMVGAFEGLTISAYPCREELVVAKHHVPTSIVYRREDAMAGAIYNPQIQKWQDWSFAVGLLDNRWKRGLENRIGFIHGAFHEYRVHGDSRRISAAAIDEYEMVLRTVEAHFGLFQKYYGKEEGSEAIARRVLSLKPSRLLDLLHMAAFDLNQAQRVIRERQFALISPYSDLGIP
jgi:glycosyltransferase involved in cell wall biosynthesis